MTMFEPLLCPSRLDSSLLARGTMKLDHSVPAGVEIMTPDFEASPVRCIRMEIRLKLLVGFGMKANAWKFDLGIARRVRLSLMAN
jgi:hypothetical protein